MPSKRTKATSISQSVKFDVCERDKYKCIYCGTTYGLTIAHYISRANGGLGIPQNLACVCMECHRQLDQSTHRKVMLEQFEKYLISKYSDWNVNDLKYRKGKTNEKE